MVVNVNVNKRPLRLSSATSLRRRERASDCKFETPRSDGYRGAAVRNAVGRLPPARCSLSITECSSLRPFAQFITGNGLELVYEETFKALLPVLLSLL